MAQGARGDFTVVVRRALKTASVMAVDRIGGTHVEIFWTELCCCENRSKPVCRNTPVLNSSRRPCGPELCTANGSRLRSLSHRLSPTDAFRPHLQSQRLHAFQHGKGFRRRSAETEHALAERSAAHFGNG